MPYTVGLDWGSTAHAVCILDQAGTLILGLGVRIEPPDVLQIELDWQKKTLAEGIGKG